MPRPERMGKKQEACYEAGFADGKRAIYLELYHFFVHESILSEKLISEDIKESELAKEIFKDFLKEFTKMKEKMQ